MSKDANPNAGQGEGGDAGAEGQNGDTGTGTDNAGNAGTGTAANAGTKALTLTQDELDAIVERRLAKERRDNASIAEKAQKWDAHEAEQQTEAEKAEKAAKAREDAIAEREQKANGRLIRATAIEAVRAANVDAEFEDLVVEAISRDAEVNDEGEVTGVAESLKALLKDKPKLVAGEVKPTPGKSGGEFGGQPGGQSMAEKLKELEGKGKAGVREAIALKLSGNRSGS